jgi:putative acetyltransferase
MSIVAIRAASPADAEAVFEVNRRAFGEELEARLVEALTGRVEPCISLVAELDGTVCGHIFFTPVHVRPEGDQAGSFRALGLGPMSVLPEHQNRGIGSKLVREGLRACRKIEEMIVFVLGHPHYYPRFGFIPCQPLGLRFEAPVPDEVFLVIELEEGALAGRTGTVHYHPEFSGA